MNPLPHLVQAMQTSPGSLEDGSRTGTLVVTAGCYLLALAAAAVAVSQARRRRYLGLGCLLGAFTVSWGEAIYDRLFHLAFYARDMTLWSPFGIDQPWWVPPGYTAAYGLGGWLVAERILGSRVDAAPGTLTRARIGRFLGVAWAGCAAFETVAYHLGVLRYFDNSITVFGMPYWHEMFNAVFIVVAGIAVATVQPLLRGAGPVVGLAVPVAVYAVGFTGITYGTGFLALAAHNSAMPPIWVGLAAVAGNVMALLLLWLVVDLVARVERRADRTPTSVLTDQGER
ncbi:MAG TPA: hypothetical protein VL595_26010 [Pseudonocardia sp.]|nr:hypothetical protein [Pseudonocardia sp.]